MHQNVLLTKKLLPIITNIYIITWSRLLFDTTNDVSETLPDLPSRSMGDVYNQFGVRSPLWAMYSRLEHIALSYSSFEHDVSRTQIQSLLYSIMNYQA